MYIYTNFRTSGCADLIYKQARYIAHSHKHVEYFLKAIFFKFLHFLSDVVV